MSAHSHSKLLRLKPRRPIFLAADEVSITGMEGAGNFDGVYHRMEDHDPTKRFKNKMRLSIAGSRAAFQAKNKERTELPIRWLDGMSFELDWGPVSTSWDRGVFRYYSGPDGAKGLMEDGRKY